MPTGDLFDGFYDFERNGDAPESATCILETSPILNLIIEKQNPFYSNTLRRTPAQPPVLPFRRAHGP